MIKICQQKQKQNTFNENLTNKASDPEKITDVNWLKYKLRFWRCNKSFLQTIFCTEFCKLCAIFDTSLNCNRNYLTFLIFKTNMFFQIWQLFLAQSTLNWYGWKPLFSGNSAKKCVRFNLHVPSESFFKVGRLEEKSVPKQREFGSSNWRHIFFSYLR